MNTSEINAALRARFCAPEWALLFNVGDGTGINQRRWADAVAMNLWPSRGLEIHGFEVKASRSDWLRELKQPAKSAPVQQYCDRWWVVAAHDIVKNGELPPTWGLIEAKNGKLRTIVPAPKLESKEPNRAFIAAMLRRAGEADEQLVSAAVKAEVDRQRAGDRERIEHEIKRRTARATDIAEKIAEIEAVSGIEIKDWTDSIEIGRAVKMVVDSGIASTYGGLDAMRREAERFAKKCEKAMNEFQPQGAEQAPNQE